VGEETAQGGHTAEHGIPNRLAGRVNAPPTLHTRFKHFTVDKAVARMDFFKVLGGELLHDSLRKHLGDRPRGRRPTGLAGSEERVPGKEVHLGSIERVNVESQASHKGGPRVGLERAQVLVRRGVGLGLDSNGRNARARKRSGTTRAAGMAHPCLTAGGILIAAVILEAHTGRARQPPVALALQVPTWQACRL
jgi:hypothetical protein